MSFREASVWCGIWVGLAASFGAAVFFLEGSVKGLEFVTGYVIEWSLSVDNLFVFIVIFRYFAVPPAFQHRVLFWGIMGAIVLRGIFIAAGVGLLTYFHWTIYLFGAFLVYTGVKLLRAGEVEVEPQETRFSVSSPASFRSKPVMTSRISSCGGTGTLWEPRSFRS